MTATEIWGTELYGDPCRECGFDWTLTNEEAMEMVAEFPADFSRILEGSDATARLPGLSWSASAYVCHVADNLRIWAERLSGARLSGVLDVPGYDQDLLAQARNYNDISLGAALWSIGSAAELWRESVLAALAGHVVLNHATMGRVTTADTIRATTHDGFHHIWDVQRIVDFARN